MSKYPILDTQAIIKILNERFREGFLTLKDLPDPLAFRDMKKAILRIIEAIKTKERIVIIGDYDVDGVISTSILRLFFKEINYPIEWIIPNRFKDGYGLSPTLLERIDRADLIITVDNGISANESANICKARGIDLIITDHHIVPKDVPEAYAIVNQKQLECSFPYKEICGAQIAWYLVAGINREIGLNVDIKSYLELVALAIIADIMPLNHINRAMVKSGLRLLANSHRPFIVAYRELYSKENFSAEDIAFFLAPLLNSAGRLEDASLACEFICSETLKEARERLYYLQELNNQRKLLESEITKEAISLIDNDSSVILAVGGNWHEGVLGIVASRLANSFMRPAIVLTKTKGGILKGSGRSFGECNLFELVDGARGLMEKFGGHKDAIGLSIKEENLEALREYLKEYGDKCKEFDYQDPDILGVLPLDSITQELYEAINSFEPFGYGNPKPKFIAYGVEVCSLKRIGSSKEHLKLLLKDKDSYIEALYFNPEKDCFEGEKIDILYTLNENSFRGVKSLQLFIEGFKR